MAPGSCCWLPHLVQALLATLASPCGKPADDWVLTTEARRRPTSDKTDLVDGWSCRARRSSESVLAVSTLQSPPTPLPSLLLFVQLQHLQAALQRHDSGRLPHRAFLSVGVEPATVRARRGICHRVHTNQTRHVNGEFSVGGYCSKPVSAGVNSPLSPSPWRVTGRTSAPSPSPLGD